MHITRITLAIGLGLLLAANGFLMLADPAGWYAMVPGVPETGPLNPHFVRDIGAAYLVTGVAIATFALDARAGPAALAGALFLTLHALVHVAEAMTGAPPDCSNSRREITPSRFVSRSVKLRFDQCHSLRARVPLRS